MGVTNLTIASTLKVDEITIRRDLKRINSLRLQETTGKIEEHRARSVAVYRRVQQAAWQVHNAVGDRSLNKVATLTTVKGCEDSIAKLLGSEAAVPQEITGTVTHDHALSVDDETARLLADLIAHGVAARAAQLPNEEAVSGNRDVPES